MSNKVFVKTKAPILVRLYNFLLLFCGRIHFIKYEYIFCTLVKKRQKYDCLKLPHSTQRWFEPSLRRVV